MLNSINKPTVNKESTKAAMIGGPHKNKEEFFSGALDSCHG